jgi:hypothetical protein
MEESVRRELTLSRNCELKTMLSTSSIFYPSEKEDTAKHHEHIICECFLDQIFGFLIEEGGPGLQRS